MQTAPMMTPEQFEKMLEKLEDRRAKNLQDILNAVLPAREDRERLIKIDSKIESISSMMAVMRTEDLNKILLADNKAASAHRRLDSQFMWVVGTVIVTVGGMILTALYVYMKLGA